MRGTSGKLRVTTAGRCQFAAAAVLASVCALFATAAPASAGDKYLGTASYPGMTTFSAGPTRSRSTGAEHQRLRVTKTCPNAAKVSGPATPASSPPARPPRATSPASSRAWSRSSQERRDLEVTPERLGPAPAPRRLARLGPRADLRLGRGEDDRTLPQGYGLKVGATENWGLNQMIHNLNADRWAPVYITWEIDWVPARPPPGPHQLRHPVARRRRRPQIYPVFDAERGFDIDGDGECVFPDDVPTDPSVPGYEERENISPAPEVDGAERRRDAGLRCRSPAPRRHERRPRGGARRPRRRHRRRRRRRPRSSRCSAPTPVTTSPPARSAGTSAWRRPGRDWRIRLQGRRHGLGQRHLQRQARPPGTSRWGSSRSPGPGLRPARPGTRSTTQAERSRPCTRRAASSPTAGLRENIDNKARKDLGLPDPREPAPARARCPASGIDIGGFVYTHGGYSADPAHSRGPDAAADRQGGRHGHLHQPRRAARRARRPSRSGTASPRARRPATRARGSATRSPTDRSSSTPASSATAPSPARGHDRLEPVHDPAAGNRQARAGPTPTSAGSTRSCGARSGSSP